jgi:predicted DNA-binding transcriptional regulator AlpA
VLVTETQQDIILTVAEVAELLRCKESSVYNLTRRRGAARYDNPIPVLRLPCGLRFKKSSILAWLESQETRGDSRERAS